MFASKRHLPFVIIVPLTLVLLISSLSLRAENQSPKAITISGTVMDLSGVPVAGAVIEAWLPTDEGASTTTNAAGFYQLSLPPGDISMFVRPPMDSRLAQRQFSLAYRDTSFTQNFEVEPGYLLSGTVLLPNGNPPNIELGVAFEPLSFSLPDGEFLGAGTRPGSGEFQVVIPEGIYSINITPPPPYYPTYQRIDLTAGDVTGVVLTLSDELVNPIPTNPPDASKIAFGAVNDLGEATVTGAPGATLPLANVLLVNLNSTHQAHTTSEADGSFSSRIYAPPGSALMVKHGPPGGRWSELEVGLAEGINPFPGTIIHVPYNHANDHGELSFATSGAVEFFADDEPITRNYVGAAWSITGTLSPVTVEGEWMRVLAGRYESETVAGLYLGGLNWTHPALADLDGDDDLDLLVGERSGQLVLYRNLGNTAVPDWQFETADYAGVSTGWWAYPALSDVTNDGAPDLFVGTGDGLVQIYYNTGMPTTPVWPATPDVTLTVGNNAAPALADLDNDGILDLVVGQEGGTLSYFQNNGTPSNPAWMLQTSSYANVNEPDHGLQPTFIDLDSDDDLDLLIGRSGDLVWYRNDGPAANPTWTRVMAGYMGFGGSSAVSPGVGDWDNDKDADLITGEHWGNLRFFRNDGPPNWTEKQNYTFPFELLGDTAPALSDWDNDGDLDMLIGQAHGEVHQYTNIGNATNPDWQFEGILLTLPWTNHPHAFPALADIDGDNAPELFVGEGGWQGPGAGGNIHYYHNDGTASMPNWTLVTDNWLGLDVGGWSTPVFVDIDNDEDLDLFIGAEDGTLTFVENAGTSSTPAWATPVNPYAALDLGDYSAPAFSDVDEDADLDMLVGLEHGSLAYVRNTGTTISPTWEFVTSHYPGVDVGERAMPAAADLNGDNDPDLLIGDGDGGLNFYRYVGPGSPPSNTYVPGDLFQVDSAIHLHSPAITAATDVNAIAVDGALNLMMIANANGEPVAARNAFMSTLLTPSGFPIQRPERSSLELNIRVEADNLRHIGGHTIEGDLTVAGQIPGDLPPGTYRPFIFLNFTGVPTNTEWLAANVTHQYTFFANEAALPPITIGDGDPLHLLWRLLMNDFVQGTRGTGARADQGKFELASEIVSQGAPFYVPSVDVRTGHPITYRLEPFLPMISFTDRRMPAPPLIPFDLPGGELCVTIQTPNGATRNLGCEAPAQSFNRTKTTRAGHDLNSGTVQLEDVYSLKAASDRFRTTFDQYGHYIITTTGNVNDLWGNTYTGGGTYDVWIAQPLDIDPGVLPGTPLAVGDAFNPAMQFYPRVPANVKLTVTHYPDSDPAQRETYTRSGQANSYGYFSGEGLPITLTKPGEYKVDVTAVYTDPDGMLYMGTMTWGSVVMTPPAEADLIAHGRRGLDSLEYIPNQWFVAGRDLIIPEGAVSHALNPYFNGDMLWSRVSDDADGGNALIMGASVQDTVGTIKAAIQTRLNRVNPVISGPGSPSERFSKGEIPLFTSTYSGRPAQMAPDNVDQVAYSYRTSQRPGVRVREVVAEDGESGGYWRLNTLYDDQLGVGVTGDQPNDFKFQYVGAVYRDLETEHNEYLGQGSGWIFIPDDDPLGNRVMPPFSGPGNGGWTTEGGPILTLKEKEIHIFILPTGTRPGAVLQVGDTFRFAGHIMPTLDSKVNVTVTAPSGAEQTISGQANRIGYFYNPDDDFVVDEPGLWSVDVQVWHDGQIGSGEQVNCDPSDPFNPALPCPSGNVLGSENGRYYVYVVPQNTERLGVTSPAPGFLSFSDEVTSVAVSGPIPPDLNNVTIDYTVTMPGYILEQGQANINGNTYNLTFDPVALHEDFPNLDLTSRDDWRPGLSDTFTINFLLRGQRGGRLVHRANTITIQGEQVFVGSELSGHDIYLPLVSKRIGSSLASR